MHANARVYRLSGPERGWRGARRREQKRGLFAAHTARCNAGLCDIKELLVIYKRTKVAICSSEETIRPIISFSQRRKT